MLDDCKHKRDDFRPPSENVQMSKLRMCLSRFENPLKKTNNEKGKVKLLNHSKILLGLGEKWITSKVYMELYTVDYIKGVYGVVYSRLHQRCIWSCIQ